MMLRGLVKLDTEKETIATFHGDFKWTRQQSVKKLTRAQQVSLVLRPTVKHT